MNLYNPLRRPDELAGEHSANDMPPADIEPWCHPHFDAARGWPTTRRYPRTEGEAFRGPEYASATDVPGLFDAPIPQPADPLSDDEHDMRQDAPPDRVAERLTWAQAVVFAAAFGAGCCAVYLAGTVAP